MSQFSCWILWSPHFWTKYVKPTWPVLFQRLLQMRKCSYLMQPAYPLQSLVSHNPLCSGFFMSKGLMRWVRKFLDLWSRKQLASFWIKTPAPDSETAADAIEKTIQTKQKLWTNKCNKQTLVLSSISISVKKCMCTTCTFLKADLC